MAISETVAEGRRADDDRGDQRQGRRAWARKLEPVVVDPASNWPLFAEKARQLITQDKVAVVFGCWTSVSRKSVLPVFEELNGLLFYPVQYEGEELSKNVFYTGAAPNQQAIPAVEYLMSKEGGGAKRWVLLGTDYVYPRTTNKILRAFLKSKGVAEKDIEEKYTPFGHSDYQTIVADIKKFAAGGKTAVVSTINGDSNVPFYKELGNQGLKATDVPVVAFSVGEEELRGVDTKPLVGHLAAWNYFMSLKNPQNEAFIKKWAAYAKAKKLPGADKAVTNDPMEATYIGIHMWKQAVEKAKSTDTDKVDRGDGRPDVQGAVGLRRSRWTRRTTTCTSRCSSARSRPTASSTSCGRPRARSAPQPWSPFIAGNEKKKDEPETEVAAERAGHRPAGAAAAVRRWPRPRRSCRLLSTHAHRVLVAASQLLVHVAALGRARSRAQLGRGRLAISRSATATSAQGDRRAGRERRSARRSPLLKALIDGERRRPIGDGKHAAHRQAAAS